MESLKRYLSNGLSGAFRKMNLSKEYEAIIRAELYDAVSKCMDGYFKQRENELQQKEQRVEEIEYTLNKLRTLLFFPPEKHLDTYLKVEPK